MAQLIFKDSGLLLDEGDTAENYADTDKHPEYDPNFHDIVDTGQTFQTFVMTPGQPTTGRVPDRETWFYVNGVGKFYLNQRRRHAILSAAAELIGEARWEEIQDALEEQGPIHEYFADLDLQTVKRKVIRAREKGLITQAEILQLRSLLPNGA